MEKPDTILNQTLPYPQLAKLGISQQQADNLPQDVKNDLLKGKVTPLLQVEVPTSNGAVVTMPVKLQVIRNIVGELLLVAYPAQRDLNENTANMLGLTEKEKESLRKGNVISLDAEGRKSYLQMDPATKAIIHKTEKEVKINQVLNNLETIKDIGLGLEQKKRAIEGKPIELSVGDTKVSVGVDLKEPQGFKLMKGGLDEWKYQQEMKYDRDHPEYIGLVKTDENRWEYQQVISRDSRERVINLNQGEDKKQTSGLKI